MVGYQNVPVTQALLEAVEREAAGETIAEVRIGLGYTAVVLEDGRTGIAYTLQGGPKACCAILDEAGSLKGRRAEELLHRAFTGHGVWRSIGVATINAMAPQGDLPEVEGNIVEFLNAGKDDRVGMVGYFAPLMTLKERVGELIVMEDQPLDAPHIHPSHLEQQLLPGCTVAILTAVTVVNGTFDKVIRHCGDAREIVLLGPSTPMYPQVLAPYGITVLGGIRVADFAELLRVIGEGGGTRQLGATVRKVNVRIPKAGNRAGT